MNSTFNFFNSRAQCVEEFTGLLKGNFGISKRRSLKILLIQVENFHLLCHHCLGKQSSSSQPLALSSFSDVTFYWSGVICIGGRWTESCADDLFILESKSKRIFREGETAGVEEEPSRSLDPSFSPSEPRGRWCASPSN